MNEDNMITEAMIAAAGFDGKTVTGVMEVVADRLDQNRIDKNIRIPC
jgi:hypothetical protein